MRDTERFTKWQGITRDQFGALSRLILGLATALIAFQASSLAAARPVTEGRGLVTWALLLLAGSVALGLWCAWNRLIDSRQSAQNARGGSPWIDTRKRGQFSWYLLGGQLWLFGIGALLVGARILS
jgi:4-hydroxybenzoate polyprenyltransferase